MAQFEAEIKNSIGQLQATVAKLAAETERANTSMRGLSTSTRQVAGDVALVGANGDRSMKSLARGATAAGAGFGGITSALTTMNPMFLLAGVAVGAITSKVVELVDEMVNASEKAQKLAEDIRKAKAEAYKKDLGIALGANIQERREAAAARFRTSTEEPIDPGVWLAGRIGQEHGMSEKDARAAAELEKRKGDYLASGAGIFAKAPAVTDADLQRAASGFGDDRSGFDQAELARKYGPEAIQNRILEEAQRTNELLKQANERRAIDHITGVRGYGGSDQVDAARADLESTRAQMVSDSQ